MTGKTANMNIPFKQWVRREPENRRVLVLSLIFSIISFIILKWKFPFPNFLPDSYSYLEAASTNRGINMWPIGYSSFLRLLSCFTNSDKLLVLVQYLLLQASILYFLFTIRYIHSPGRWLFRILVIVCMINPLSLLIANFVSSDTLFAALSLIWLTQLLWILYRPGIALLIFHAFILVFAFMVRYNALYYPLVSTAIILFTPLSIGKKLIALGSLALVLGCFIAINIAKYKTFTGAPQFSAFGGWQLASNALFAYAHSTPDAPEKLPESLRPLQRIVNHHMDSLSRLKTRPDQQLGIYYLWDEGAPLKEYLHEKWRNDPTGDGFKQWASMAPIYSAYGSWLIRHHLTDFINHYLLPNMVNYYAPSAEFMNIYNMGKDSVDDMARWWFSLKSKKVYSGNKNIVLAEVFPIFLALVNLLFLLCFICVWSLGGFRRSEPGFSKALWCVAFIWLANFGFSVLASPVVLRYQIFPMIFTSVFMALMLEFIIRESRSSSVYSDTSNNKYENRNRFIPAGQPGRLQQQ
jgi:hypothetical protein